MNDLTATRRLVEMQGFTGLDDETLIAINPWLRLAPATLLIGIGIGSVAASAIIMWAMVPFTACSALFGTSPIDALYNHGMRRLRGGPRLPRYRAPRRFAFTVASVLLLTTGWAFHQGALATGYVLGCLMSAAVELQVMTGFCLGAWIHSRCFAMQETQTGLPAPSSMIDR